MAGPKVSAPRRDPIFDNVTLLSRDRSQVLPERLAQDSQQLPQETAHSKGKRTPGSKDFQPLGSDFFPRNVGALSTIKLICSRGCSALP